jgi:hypothetical protein
MKEKSSLNYLNYETRHSTLVTFKTGLLDPPKYHGGLDSIHIFARKWGLAIIEKKGRGAATCKLRKR